MSSMEAAVLKINEELLAQVVEHAYCPLLTIVDNGVVKMIMFGSCEFWSNEDDEPVDWEAYLRQEVQIACNAIGKVKVCND